MDRCNSLPDNSDKIDCYMEIIAPINDPAKCEGESTEELKDNCYTKIAARTNNETICGMIQKERSTPVIGL